MTSTESNLIDRILKQLQFYFSDANLRRDKFLLEQLSKKNHDSSADTNNTNGYNQWVPLEIICSFQRMKSFEKSPEEIANLVEMSENSFLEISRDITCNEMVENKICIRRRIEFDPSNLKIPGTDPSNDPVAKRTLFVTQIPKQKSLDELIHFFNELGDCAMVRRKMSGSNSDGEKHFTGCAWVEFKTESEAMRVLSLPEVSMEFLDENGDSKQNVCLKMRHKPEVLKYWKSIDKSHTIKLRFSLTEEQQAMFEKCDGSWRTLKRGIKSYFNKFAPVSKTKTLENEKFSYHIFLEFGKPVAKKVGRQLSEASSPLKFKISVEDEDKSKDVIISLESVEAVPDFEFDADFLDSNTIIQFKSDQLGDTAGKVGKEVPMSRIIELKGQFKSLLGKYEADVGYLEALDFGDEQKELLEGLIRLRQPGVLQCLNKLESENDGLMVQPDQNSDAKFALSAMDHGEEEKYWRENIYKSHKRSREGTNDKHAAKRAKN